MIDAQDIRRHYNWEMAPHDTKQTRWSSLYATIAPNGNISLTRVTHEALGAPEAYQILYDRNLHVLGLQPARRGANHAYPVHPHTARGGKRLRAYRIIRQFSLYLNETVRFPRCFIDRSGILILDMKDVIPCGRKRKLKKGEF
ncbi:MAG: hypothetical protein JO314_02635 [Acidobacteria bacterium]|nr:hypothetical protein [Acidobacteriota bacterium]